MTTQGECLCRILLQVANWEVEIWMGVFMAFVLDTCPGNSYSSWLVDSGLVDIRLLIL